MDIAAASVFLMIKNRSNVAASGQKQTVKILFILDLVGQDRLDTRLQAGFYIIGCIMGQTGNKNFFHGRSFFIYHMNRMMMSACNKKKSGLHFIKMMFESRIILSKLRKI